MMMMKIHSAGALLLTLLSFVSNTNAQQQQQQHQLVRGNALATASEAAPKRRRRLQLCLGIFQDCDEEDDSDGDDVQDGNATEVDGDNVQGGAGGGILGDFCLGIFRDCDDTSNSAIGGNSTSPTNCDDESTSGVFGGRPIFGKCGIINEILDVYYGNSTNTTDFNVTATIEEVFGSDYDIDNNPFGLSLPEGGLLWELYNRDDDVPLLEAIVNEFRANTQQIAFGFLQDWSESAVTNDNICENENTAPKCLDQSGFDGFWVCRTLTDPFTGVAGSKNDCIGEGFFLENNDECGCCGAECPPPCECLCDLNGGTANGVLVNTVLGDDTTTETACVNPKWAVSMTNRFDRITCAEECPQN